MRKILMVGLGCIMVSGCAQQFNENGVPILEPQFLASTAPGTEIPLTFKMCKGVDEHRRCNDWGGDSGWCVNPKGQFVDPPVVPCSEIKE